MRDCYLVLKVFHFRNVFKSYLIFAATTEIIDQEQSLFVYKCVTALLNISSGIFIPTNIFAFHSKFSTAQNLDTPHTNYLLPR
jgi:hypothetical protein